MEIREKILQAAARVYAEAGFRGATTRRIAAEADVNEVTLFRIFGSKAAMILEATRCHAMTADAPQLPDQPVDPERELTDWCAAHLAGMRERRSLIRTMMAELDERPEIIPCASQGPTRTSERLLHYLSRLQADGRIGPAQELRGPVAMLMGSVFFDATGREMMPELFPQPEEDAARVYVAVFLRAIGFASRGEHVETAS